MPRFPGFVHPIQENTSQIIRFKQICWLF